MPERRITRRRVLAGAVGVAGAAAAGVPLLVRATGDAPSSGRVSPHGDAVARAEQVRRGHGTGRTVRVTLAAESAEVDLGGRMVRTWAYDGQVPGPTVRARAGDQLEVELANRLPEPTTVHWHGLRIRNDMDDVLTTLRGDHGDHDDMDMNGRMGMAQYRTTVQVGQIPDRSGTWQYHVPPALAKPPPGTPMASPASRLASHVRFPFYLLGGRLPTAPHTFRAKPGRRARIRLINAAGATVFRVALGGHRLTVTHTDGFPVEPVTVDTLRLASGERYDLTATLADGSFPLVAVAEGKQAQALGVVRTATGPTPPPDADPTELAGRLLALDDPRATHTERRPPDVSHTTYLTGDMRAFAWRINAETYHDQQPFDGITPMTVHEGRHVRLELVNQTPMYHPMHLHGRTFTVGAGIRKDTVMVPPGDRLGVDFTADNPGQWLVHCHNAYHMATGMAAMLSYQTKEDDRG